MWYDFWTPLRGQFLLPGLYSVDLIPLRIPPVKLTKNKHNMKNILYAIYARDWQNTSIWPWAIFCTNFLYRQTSWQWNLLRLGSETIISGQGWPATETASGFFRLRCWAIIDLINTVETLFPFSASFLFIAPQFTSWVPTSLFSGIAEDFRLDGLPGCTHFS